ncbi:MAG: hypothetical protein V3V20_11915 [Algisphaera sp.]
MSCTPDLFCQHPNPVWIETGTYLGDGVQAALDAGFAEIHSIELSSALHQQAKERFANNPNVHLHQGDSATCLAPLIASINQPITFWLDGHYSEGNTARGESNTPLQRELAAIAAHPLRNHTLLIDDVRCFGTDVFEGYTLDSALTAIQKIRPDYLISYADGTTPGDILVAVPPA